MIQKRTTFLLLLIGVTLAFVGLIALQAVLLNHAWELKTQSFRQNVNAAMSSIVQKVETHEMAMSVVSIAVGDSTAESFQVANWFGRKANDSLQVNNGFSYQYRVSPDSMRKLVTKLPGFPEYNVLLHDSVVHDSGKRVENIRITASSKRLNDSTDRRWSGTQMFTTDVDSFGGQPGSHFAMAFGGPRRQVLISRVLDQMQTVTTLPVAARIQQAVLDSIVHTTLAENGIDLDYAYGVRASAADTLVMLWPADRTAALRKAEFQTPLFPHDIFGGQDELLLHFPDQNFYMLRETGLLFVASFFLMAIIVAGFVYAVRTIFRQQRFATSLSSFINNMIHEFKTPISTISLAAEAMSNPATHTDSKRFGRYTQIIRDENSRMRQQVEKILQMAVLEKGEYELHLDEVDVHEIIRNAIVSIALQVEKRGGRVVSDLRASISKMKVDAFHLANIVHNLLDNANKYTSDEPHITVSTENASDGIRIKVADNGIGLRSEDQERIFEKYYRVSTGNVHDVKGFGLGLSYVRMMVQAHGGQIAVQSEYKHGATFEVFLPFVAAEIQNSKTERE